MRVLEPQEVFLGREYLSMGNRMAENGVIFLSGQKEGKYAESYAAMYKGVVIEEFSKAEMQKFYKKWGKLQDEETPITMTYTRKKSHFFQVFSGI